MSKKILKKSTSRRKAPSQGLLERSQIVETDFKYTSTLYRFVYATKTSTVLGALLLLSFFTQGAPHAFASEDSELDAATEVAQETITPVPDLVIEDGASEEYEVSTPVAETEEEDLVEAEDSELDHIVVTPLLEEEDDIDESAVNSGSGSSETASVNSEQSQSDEEQSVLPEDLEEPQLLPAVEAEATANQQVVSVTESDSIVSFSKDECILLASGSYYCSAPEQNTLKDALFAAQDAEGDMEIYFVKNGVQTQITNNSVDDAAPYYDQNTETIVWHRLIEDRFQIISYDIPTGQESILTNTSENNMEPTRQGKYTVWQRWIGGGWNIILHNGEKEEQITNTTSHDVAPYIHGTLVVWNRHAQDGTKTIEMYDVVAESYVTIDDPDGLSVSNPRMVFVYDSLHPNGDIVTKGYDVLAKRFINLDSLPRELPTEIPSSDSTGETRALIQSKPSQKSEVEEVVDGNASSTPVAAAVPPELATSTEALVLDLTSATTSDLVQVVVPQSSDPSLVEFDLVIEPFQSIATSSETVQD
jgi:hypothetical protein